MLAARFVFAATVVACTIGLCPVFGQQACPFSTGNQGGFNVAGTVVRADGNQPLGRAYVVLGTALRPQDQVYCLTGDDGRFGFLNIPAGKYNLSARKAGYRNQSFRGDEAYSTAIVTGPNLDSEHIVFPMHASAKLTGHALDEEGDPVPNATVFLFQKGVHDGLPSTRMAGQKNTDSSGRFHFGDLEAGTYLLAISGRPWYAVHGPHQQMNDPQAAAEIAARNVAYPITYYPDSTDPESAGPIQLAEGGAAEIQINLHPLPALRVSVDDPSGKTPQNRAMVQVMELGPGGFPMMVNAETEWTPEGLKLNGLTTGRYQVSLSQFGKGRPTLVGRKIVDVTSDLTLDLAATSDKLNITGQIASDTPAQGKQHFGLQFLNASTGFPLTAAEENGSFTVADGNLVPGRYEVRVTSPDHYIKSVSVKGAKYASGILEVGPGATVQLAIVVSSGMGQVNGFAVEGDKPFPGAVVLLFPQDPNRGAFIGRDQSDSDGSFSMRFVPPGRYSLVAIDDGHDLPFRDPAAMKPYLAQAVQVEVTTRDAATVKAAVQPRIH